MNEKIKLTELTREELRQVTGGKTGGEEECTCRCGGNTQNFGARGSAAKGEQNKKKIKV